MTLIGPSSTQGAPMRLARRAAMNVIVCQGPWGRFGMQAFATRRLTSQGRHVALGPGLVSENQPPWINAGVVPLPDDPIQTMVITL